MNGKRFFGNRFISHRKKSYPHFLLYLKTFQHVPEWIVDILLNDRMILLGEKMNLSRCYKAVYIIGEMLRLIHKGIIAMRNRDYDRIIGYYKRRRLNDPVVAGRKA